MPNLNQSQHKLKIVAVAPNFQDFVEALIAMRDEISDIRTLVPGVDSIESRKSISDYLTFSIDNLKRIRNNQVKLSNNETIED